MQSLLVINQRLQHPSAFADNRMANLEKKLEAM